MGLIQISDIEAALGSDISSEDETRVQKYIDIVSRFVARETGTVFGPVDTTIKAVADGKGIIEINSLNTVTSVEILDGTTNVYSDVNAGFYYAFNSGLYDDRHSYGYTGYGFDGISKVYSLCPYGSYKITANVGEPTPEEIKDLIILLVLAGAGLDSSATGGIKSYRVGDVEEQYGITESGSVTLSSLMRATLDSYVTGSDTYRL